MFFLIYRRQKRHNRSWIHGAVEGLASFRCGGEVLDVPGEVLAGHAQAAFLTAQGCDELQGYLIGRPVSAKEVVRYLELQKTDEDSE